MTIIRASREGLTIHLSDGAFEQALSRLSEKLAESDQFFQGAHGIRVIVDPGMRSLTDEQIDQLATALAPKGLVLSGILVPVRRGQTRPAAGNGESAGKTAAVEMPPELVSSTKVVTRTLRSGQSVHHNGDVIVLGDVNPGAEVVATGHIVVMGALKGIAHAGATGYMEAIVGATKLRPMQLRIGHMIARSPDDAPVSDEDPVNIYPEVARVQDGHIVIVAART